MREDEDSLSLPVIAVAILMMVAFLPVVIYHEAAMLLARIKERARDNLRRSMAAPRWARGRRPAKADYGRDLVP
jgi:hypothetical protein